MKDRMGKRAMLFEALCVGWGQITQGFGVEFEVLRCYLFQE